MKNGIKKIAVIYFLCIITFNYGCTSSNNITTQTSHEAADTTLASQETTQRTVTTAPLATEASVQTVQETTAPAAIKTCSFDWENKNDQGYSWTVSLTEWNPVIGGNQEFINHPFDSRFSINTSDGDYNSAKDAIVPVMISLKNTTVGYDLENSSSSLWFHTVACNDSGVTDYLNTINNSIDVLSWGGNSGTDVNEYSLGLMYSTNIIKVTALNTGVASPGLWWNPIPSGETYNALFFVIIHDFITPANPKGNMDLLDYVAIFPDPISKEAITLSGKVITYDYPDG